MSASPTRTNTGNAFNPIAAALLASAGLGLLAASAASCTFLVVDTTEPDGHLVILEPSAARSSSSVGTTLESQATIGFFCGVDGNYYDLSADPMWIVSRTFMFLSLAIVALSTIIAWSISTVCLPTWTAWKLISALSGLSAVVQVPVFLVFETEPCSDYKAQQYCSMSTGSVLLVASMVCSLAVTLVTQILDPPSWVSALDEWRTDIKKSQTARSSSMSRSSDSGSGVQGEGERRAERNTIDPSPVSSFRRKFSRKGNKRDLSTASSKKGQILPDTTFPDLEVGVDDHYRGLPNNNTSTENNWPFSPQQFFDSPSASYGPASALVQRERQDQQKQDMSDVESSVARSAVRVEDGEDTDGDTEVYYDAAGEFPRDPDNDTLDDSRPILLPEQRDSDAPEIVQKDPPRPDTEVPEALAPATEAQSEASHSKNQESGKRLTPSMSRRRIRQTTRYALLDDDDIESSFPFSPPLEIVTTAQDPDDEDITHDDDEDIFFGVEQPPVADEQEDELIDIWNALYNSSGPVPLFTTEKVPITSTREENLFSRQPEADQPTKKDPSSQPFTAHEWSLDNLGFVNPDPPLSLDLLTCEQDLIVAEVQRRLPSRSRRRRRRQNKSSMSVTSSPSLLDTTIREETPSDLEETDVEQDQRSKASGNYGPYCFQRTQSMPTFATNGFVEEEKKMDDFYELRQAYNEAREEKKSATIRFSNSAESKKAAVVTPSLHESTNKGDDDSSSLHSERRIPLFREERDLKGGIHDTTGVSVMSEITTGVDGGGGEQVPSSQVREARIQRLQKQLSQGVSRELEMVRVPSTDSSDLESEMLDLQLIDLQRPDGEEYGPEEASL